MTSLKAEEPMHIRYEDDRSIIIAGMSTLRAVRLSIWGNYQAVEECPPRDILFVELGHYWHAFWIDRYEHPEYELLDLDEFPELSYLQTNGEWNEAECFYFALACMEQDIEE